MSYSFTDNVQIEECYPEMDYWNDETIQEFLETQEAENE